jgi:ATP-dependent DNA helicase RecG
VEADRVRELAAAGETFEVEFKSEERSAFTDAALVEAVVCLTNGRGGKLFLGIEDNGRVSGARFRHDGIRTDRERVQALISNKTQPPVATEVSVIDMGGGMHVLLVEVPPADQPVGTNKGGYVRRAMNVDGTPACVPYLAHEMLSRVIDSRQQDYARLRIIGLTWSDLDPLEFDRYRRLARSAAANGDPSLIDLSDQDIALALGLAEMTALGEVVPLAGALLVFGRVDSMKRWLPSNEVMFQVIEGTSVRVDETWNLPLLAVAEEVLRRLQPYDTQSEMQVGLTRIAVPRLPATVLREVVANALIHRDYTSNGPTVIQLNSNTFEVMSLGGFPPGVNLTNLFNVTRPRSPLLSEAFKRVGIVERSGRGVKRVYEALLQTGRRGPDYSSSNEELVHVVVPLAEGDLEIAHYFAQEAQAGRGLDLFSLQVIFELKNVGPLSEAEIADITHQNTYQARALLNALVELGYVETRRTGRRVEFHLTAGLYRALGNGSAYVRIHGFEPQQHEQMILSYIDAHGRITRGEAAGLCQVDPLAASRTLRRMMTAGQIVLVGQRKAAYYERA